MQVTKKPTGKPASKTIKSIKRPSTSPITKRPKPVQSSGNATQQSPKKFIKNENEKNPKKFIKNENDKKPKKFIKNENSSEQNAFKKNFFAKGKPDANKPLEKPNWQKFKQDKKDLKIKRKESRSKNLFKLNIEAKRLYEQLKCKMTKDKSDLAENLYQLLHRANSIQKFVLAHDTSRIIQCLLKYSSPKTRDELSKELLPISVDMATSRYAHFCILRILKYGSNSIKSELVNSLMGSILKLVNHNISSKILDMIYFNVASKRQKTYMRQELYSDLYVTTKDDNVKQLSDIYKDSLNMKNGFLSAIKMKLEHIANKKMAENSLVHAVLLEYLQEYINESSEDVAEECMEIIRIYSNLIPHLVTTRDGCLAATWCFWLSPTKDRRAILKSLKEHLEKICRHEHGHIFITAIVNTLDDTKALKKVIFDPIHSKLEEIVANHWGRKIIEWFVSPGDKKCFHPALIKFFDTGLKFSKKDKPIREKEIFEQIEKPICDSICDNPKLWVSNGHIGWLTATILKRITQKNAENVFTNLAKVICQPDWKVEVTIGNTSEVAGIEDSGMHIILKKILKSDEERNMKHEISFGKCLVDNFTNETLGDWIKYNRGCFILLIIYENSLEETQNRLKVLLKGFAKELKKGSTLGSKLLTEKLNL